jgi:hypothetical protein
MNLSLPGALAVGALLAGCAGARVDAPPPPPAFDPGARAPAVADVKDTTPDEPPAVPAQEAPVLAGKTAESTAPGAKTASQEKPAPEKPDPPLGWIAGQRLEPEELLVEWGDAASRELWLVLDKLVAARLALAEAGRLGIKLEPEDVEQRYASERQRLLAEVERSGKKRTLEEFIERDLGFDPGRYLERVRRATIRQMLAERAVRAASLATESISLRMIAVATDEQKKSVEEALAAGREFADVASELSVDDSRKNGGLVPFVLAQERSPLVRLAFQTPVGETAGPLAISDHQFWIRVEERRQPLEGDWSAIEATVEGSLAKDPVGDAEFVHWKLSMEGRYPIDLGPLWSLIGAAK